MEHFFLIFFLYVNIPRGLSKMNILQLNKLKTHPRGYTWFCFYVNSGCLPYPLNLCPRAFVPWWFFWICPLVAAIRLLKSPVVYRNKQKKRDRRLLSFPLPHLSVYLLALGILLHLKLYHAWVLPRHKFKSRVAKWPWLATFKSVTPSEAFLLQGLLISAILS